MISLVPVKQRYGDYLCRRCLNRKYHVRLQPEDCVYGYQYTCPVCKKIRSIVVDLAPKGHLKMLLKF